MHYRHKYILVFLFESTKNIKKILLLDRINKEILNTINN
jgi:hypothetical protein